MNTETGLTQVIKELQSSNLSQDLILDAVDTFDFTLAPSPESENIVDVPKFLEKLIAVATDLKTVVSTTGVSVTDKTKYSADVPKFLEKLVNITSELKNVVNTTITTAVGKENTKEIYKFLDRLISDVDIISAVENKTSNEIPKFLEKLVNDATDLKDKFDILIRSNVILAKRLGDTSTQLSTNNTNTQLSPNNTSTQLSPNTSPNNTRSNTNNTSNLNLPNIRNFTKGLVLKAMPTSFIRAYVGGIQKLFDEVSKLKLSQTTIKRVIEPLSMLSTSLENVSNFGLTKALVGLAKIKIFSKILNAFFKNASSPENLKNAKNLRAVADNLSPLETIGKSLATFANIKWIKSMLSAKALKMFLTSLSKLPLTVVEKMTGVVKKIGDALPKPLKKISDAIGDFGEKMGKVGGALIKGGIGLLALSASLIPLAIGLEMFKGIDWKTVGIAGSALAGLSAVGVLLGKNMGATLKGALGIAALGASLIPLAFSLKLLDGIKWDTLAIAGAAIAGLGLAAVALGNPAVIGMAALGAVAIALLGASLIPLAYSLERLSALDTDVLTNVGTGIGNLGMSLLKASPGLLLGGLALIPFAAGVTALGLATSLTGESLTGFMEKFTNFSNVMDPAKLFSTAGAITALSAAIASFGAGQAVEGLGNLAGKLLRFGSDSPLEQLQKFAEIGENLKTAGLGVLNLSEGISKLSKLGNEIKALKEFPVGTVEKLSEVFSKNQVLLNEAQVQPNIESAAPKTGESLNAVGNIANVAPTVVVNNNNGGNVSNISTSNVNNNAATNMPILTGSALGY